MNMLCNRIDDTISLNKDTELCNINYNDILLAIKSMKKEKSDGLSGVYSDHIINGGKRLHIHISLLLSAIVKHSRAPDAMLFSVMVPIPKNVRKT
jgi:hypothetical protein